MTYTFSKAALDILHHAGWSESYRHDTTKDERLLREEGYPIFPVVLDFLTRFGGLHLKCPARPVNRNMIVTFDIGKAVSHVFSENVQVDATSVGTPLCLIGYCEDDQEMYAMDEYGNVYYSWGTVFWLGRSGEDAIEGLSTRRKGINAEEGNHWQYLAGRQLEQPPPEAQHNTREGNGQDTYKKPTLWQTVARWLQRGKMP